MVFYFELVVIAIMHAEAEVLAGADGDAGLIAAEAGLANGDVLGVAIFIEGLGVPMNAGNGSAIVATAVDFHDPCAVADFAA